MRVCVCEGVGMLCEGTRVCLSNIKWLVVLLTDLFAILLEKRKRKRRREEERDGRPVVVQVRESLRNGAQSTVKSGVAVWALTQNLCQNRRTKSGFFVCEVLKVKNCFVEC